MATAEVAAALLPENEQTVEATEQTATVDTPAAIETKEVVEIEDDDEDEEEEQNFTPEDSSADKDGEVEEDEDEDEDEE